MSYTFEADSIVKRYDGKPILTDVFLKCNTGDILGIFGRNGTGKSTLMQILFGSLPADNAFIRVNGKVHPKPFLIKDGVCYLPQFNFIPKQLDVKNAIKLFVAESFYNEVLNDKHLLPILGTNIGQLSGGENRYLQIKLLLFNSAKFCLLDEPYNGVSPIVADLINEEILKARQRKGVIITDHNYSQLLKITSKICLIKNNTLLHLSSSDELIKYGYLNVAEEPISNPL